MEKCSSRFKCDCEGSQKTRLEHGPCQWTEKFEQHEDESDNYGNWCVTVSKNLEKKLVELMITGRTKTTQTMVPQKSARMFKKISTVEGNSFTQIPV